MFIICGGGAFMGSEPNCWAGGDPTGSPASAMAASSHASSSCCFTLRVLGLSFFLPDCVSERGENHTLANAGVLGESRKKSFEHTPASRRSKVQW